MDAINIVSTTELRSKHMHYLHEYETSRQNLNQSIKTKYDQQ